ncbi:MAG: protein-glutamate O-methyltransferase CheR [Desulfobacterales bacterium]|nr:protein-glutamate O-methyltransferase CheR [Desulfobacterales bacterium]
MFRRLIRKHVGISFSSAKKFTLQRKLTSRLSGLGLESYRAYYHYLLHDKEGGWELRQLINAITVGQTEFFRHVKQFELLANVVLPQIVTQKKTAKKLRIWSAGCATGQEVYSIAMVVDDMLEDSNDWDIKILATDIDTDALKFAYKGLYPQDCVQQVPSEYLRRYFKKRVGKDAGFCVVGKTLRKNILFRRLNFMRSGFSFKSDIIFCRNVMIYFDTGVKKKLINNFFNVLERDGFLCLGHAESLIGIDDRFDLVSRSIYKVKK